MIDMEIPIAIADEIASWRGVFAHRINGSDASDLLRRAAADLWQALEINKTVYPECQDLAHQEVVDALNDLATSAEIPPDDAQFIFAESFRAPGANGAGAAHEARDKPKSIILTNAEFVSQFEPLDYQIDGVMQRGFFYALTAPTNAGKTAVAVRIAAHVAPGTPLAGHEVLSGKVLFFAGENADDVRMRWIKTCEEIAIDQAAENLFWISGRLSISAMRERINAETDQHGPFNLIIIDSAAVFFEGDDENSNTQFGNYARMLRTLVEIKGGPSILVLCHPIKNYSLDNLVPRGGGAFLNELDSNLVLVPISEAPKVSELHWHAKHRGPDFAPISFKLTSGTSERIKDSKGRLIWTVTAAPLTRDEVDAAESTGNLRQEELLGAMERRPGASMARLAEACGWTYATGEPNKSLVQRAMADLERRGMVKLKDGHWTLAWKDQKQGKNARYDRD
jgi:hypothetical protein